MRELDAAAYLQQSCVDCMINCRDVDAETRCGTVEQDRIAERIRRRDEDEKPRVARQFQDAPGVTLFHLVRRCVVARETKSTGELRRAPCPCELEKRERIAMALGNDLIANGCIQRSVYGAQQK